MASLSANGTYVLVTTEARYDILLYRWTYVLHREKLCLRLFSRVYFASISHCAEWKGGHMQRPFRSCNILVGTLEVIDRRRAFFQDRVNQTATST